MISLFEFINDHLPGSWFDNFHQAWGDSLTDEMVLKSVQEASDFFNMNAPMEVHEDWTTGVMTGIPFTENDDILVFNRQQMLDMGITDKEGFDLVMTHEGAHRALQGLNTGFDSHQEELCCDYMAGVRAGLNGMDEGKMAASLSGTAESESHPDGVARVAAIEAGVSFAHEYMEAHNGTPPSFSECLDHFNQTDVYTSTVTPQEPGHVNLRPDVAFADDLHGHSEMKGYTQSDVDWYEHQARITTGTEQAHWLKEAEWARNHLHGFAADGVAESADVASQGLHEFHHGGEYGNATGDYWDDSHPTEDKHGQLHGFVNDKSYHIGKAESAQHNAEWHEKRAEAAMARGDLRAAKDHTDKATSFRKWEQDHIKSAQRSTK